MAQKHPQAPVVPGEDMAEGLPFPGAAQDLAAKKTDFISKLIFLSGDLLTLARRCDEAAAQYFANTFNSGGANVITQNDIVGTNIHLAVTDVTNAITAAQAMTTAMTPGTRDNLRKMLGTPDF